MGRSSGGGNGVATSKKAKFIGSFVTSECDESVYLPAIVSNLNRYLERSKRVRVAVDESELSVKRLRLLGGAKAERTPIRLLCVAHMCVTIPELVVFVMRVEGQRYNVMAFLCKKSSDARQLIDAASDAKFLADRLVVGRVNGSYDDAASDAGGYGRRFYSDDSLSCDDSVSIERDYTRYGTGGDYRVVELADASSRPRTRRPGAALSERGTSSSLARRGWSRSGAAWNIRHLDGPRDDADVAVRPQAATSLRSFAAARRSQSVTDLVSTTGGGRSSARRSKDVAGTDEYGYSRQATFAATLRSNPAVRYRTHERTAADGGGVTRPRSGDRQRVYDSGCGSGPASSRSDGEARQSYAFATRSRKVAGLGSEGAARVIGRYDSLPYSVASEPTRARSLSSANRSSESSEDDLPAEARVTTRGRHGMASSSSASSSSPMVVQADLYAVPHGRRGREQGSAYATVTLPDRQPSRRQNA